MPDLPHIRVLLIEDNKEFANLVELFLKKYEKAAFEIVWRDNGPTALSLLDEDAAFDAILMDYFLPGQNGLEITRAIQAKSISIPIVFLTVNKDFDLAVEVMKLGIEDYLVKEEITTPVLPRTILSVIERKKLRDQLTALEITQNRLQAIQEFVIRITQEIRLPLDRMRANVEEVLKHHDQDSLTNYLVIIRDNLQRVEKKLVRLKEMKTDKTVTYVKDIKMFDLSDGE